MSKYTIFFPSDVDLSDKVKDTILWQAKYKLQDESYVTADFVDKINKWAHDNEVAFQKPIKII